MSDAEGPGIDAATGGADAPLILTLRMDARSFGRLDALRRAHFPPSRNHLSAHLTLFHALPGEHAQEVAANLAAACAATAPVPLRFAGLRSFGKGVAYAVESAPLGRLRGLLVQNWHAWLSAQDRGGFRPHVTVQNKVDPAEARALFAELQAGFAPWDGTGEGLLLWRYRGGPWEAEGEFPFRG